MLHKDAKKRFPTLVFITASLAAFIALALLYLFVVIGSGIENVEPVAETAPDVDVPERFYFKEISENIDPLTEYVPSFDELLTGPIISKADPRLGDRAAEVVIVEFADFECDYCQIQEQALKRIISKYPFRVRLIWKDYPSLNPESPSFQAAIAGRCAQEQDLFWQYHDFLYDTRQGFKYETFMEIAGILGMDVTKFSDCLKTQRPKDLILDNIAEANALDINGVPFLYINSQEIMGEAKFEDLDRIVQIELKK